MVYYLNENFLKNKPYVVNKFCSQKISDEKFLLTTDHGSWVVLSNDEFNLLLKNKLEENSELYLVLEDKGLIINERNHANIEKKYNERFGYLFNGINLHVIAPTLRCNQKCVYCHANSRDIKENGYDMNEDTAKSVVDFIFQSPSKFLNIEFQGGEPLLAFPIVQFIIEYAKKKNNSTVPNNEGWFSGSRNISFTLATNLSMMDNDILNYLISNKVRISTSL